VEIFTAGCPLCQQTAYLIQQVGNGFCDIIVSDVRDETVADRVRALGLRYFPSVMVDGKLVPFDLYAAFSRALVESEWCQQLLNTLRNQRGGS
jgi:hypothetical protein